MRALPTALGLVVALVPGARAEEAPPDGSELTLRQAVAVAQSHSHRLGAADAGLAAAVAAVDAARAARLPRLELSETFLRTTNPVLVFGGLLGQERFTEESFALDRLNRPDPFTNYLTQVTLDQPLWTGGRIAHGVGTVQRQEEAVAAERERTRQEVVREVVDAYTAAVLAHRQLEVAREARQTAAAHVELVRDLYESGLVVESDLLQAEVRLSEVEEMVVRAESGAATSGAALNLAMGLSLDRRFELQDEVEPQGEAEETLATLLELAAEERPDLEARAARIAAAAEQGRAAEAERLPELGLRGAWEINGEDLLAGDGTNWSVMVALRFTAFDGFGRRARIRAAEEELRRAERLAALHRDQAALQVRQAWHEVEAARSRLEEAGRSVELARRSMTIVEDRYREGLATLVELLEAETGLTRARVREVAARRDLLGAQTALDLAVGRL